MQEPQRPQGEPHTPGPSGPAFISMADTPPPGLTPGRAAEAQQTQQHVDQYVHTVLSRPPPEMGVDETPSPQDYQVACMVNVVQSTQQMLQTTQQMLQNLHIQSQAVSYKVKPFTLKRLAAAGRDTRDLKDDMAYIHWMPAARTDIRAAGGIDVILKNRSGYHDQIWYDMTSSIVFNALYKAVSHIPTLADELMYLEDKEECAKLAWEAIRAHFIQATQWAEVEFRNEFHTFKVKSGEDMKSFLGRMEDLRTKAATYGHVLNDGECVNRVMYSLDRHWGTAVCAVFPPNTPFSAMNWRQVKAALLREDSERRGYSTKSPTALPLGWTSRQGGARAAEAAEPKPVVQTSNFTPQAVSRRFQPSGPKVTGGQKKVPQKWQDVECCWFCKKIGHRVADCRNKGKPQYYAATPADKELCDKKKKEHFASLQGKARQAVSAPSGELPAPEPEPAVPQSSAPSFSPHSAIL